MPLRIACCLASLAAIFVALAGSPAWACKTPVYRYAMYRWEPAPFEVYYLHDQEVPASDKAVHDALNQLVADPQASPNLAFRPIDLREDPELAALPRDVRDRFLAGKRELPTFLIVSPEGNEIHRGPLTAAEIEPLVDSPARKELATLLADARAGVFLVLTGKDEAATKAAEQLCRAMVEKVRSGELKLYDPEEEEKGLAGSTPQEKKSPHLPGVVVVRRDDPREAWLVRQLLSVESDLAGIDGPMIFPSFGRGRVMPPYLGKGINAENLAEGLVYVTGACACTVKEQNPGFELLTRHPWNAAADAMARRFVGEEGSGLALRDLQIFPEIDPPAKPVPKKEATPPVEPTPPTTEEPSNTQPGNSQPPPFATTHSHGADVHHEDAAHGHAAAPATAERGDPAGSMYLYLGAGIALALVVLGIASWFMNKA